jgi:hypothetical protein
MVFPKRAGSLNCHRRTMLRSFASSPARLYTPLYAAHIIIRAAYNRHFQRAVRPAPFRPHWPFRWPWQRPIHQAVRVAR